MNIIINNASMQPIYEQILSQIKTAILQGTLKEEQILPSVRSLSKDLHISALTVKKAYDALEQEGFIVTIHGKGSFVAGVNPGLVIEEQRKEVEQIMEQAIRQGQNCGMTKEELKNLFELILEE
ncbi:MAG: GntR family transcriptional regulator [Lachnospiraceae bacterium]|nr:GntR family transcriptional regulator [Lachnospiraceae bacterium]